MPFPPSVQLWAGYGHPDTTSNGGSNPSIDTLAHRVTQFIEQGYGYGQEGQAYRTSNPGNVLVLTYQLHLEVQRSGVPWWSGNQLCRNQADFDYLNQDPKSFLYRSQQGALTGDPAERLYYTNDYGVLVPFAYLDPASQRVRDFQVDAVDLILANQPGTMGIWWDNVNNAIQGARKHSSTGRVFSGTGEEYTSTTFRAKVIEALAEVRSRIARSASQPGLFAGNVIHQTYSSSSNPSVANVKFTDYVDALDLFHDESYGGYPWVINPDGSNGEWSAARMDHITQEALNWLALGPTKMFSFAMQTSTANQNDIQRLNYTIGNLALIQPANNWITIAGIRTARVVGRWTRAQTYGDWWERPELDINLGAKTGTPTKTSTGVWTVTYGSYTVTVDHNAHNATFQPISAPPPTNKSYGVRRTWHASEPMGPSITLFHGDDVVAGDEMFAILSTRDAQAVVDPLDDGWVFVGVARSTSSINLHVFRKRASAADANPQAFYSFEATNSNAAIFGGIIAYPGIDATNPIVYLSGTTTPAVAGVVGSGVRPQAPSIRPEDDAVLINIYALAWGYAGITGPQGMNPRLTHRNTEVPITVGVFDQRFDADLDTGPKEITTDATGTYVAMTIGLKVTAQAPSTGQPTLLKNLITTAFLDDATAATSFNITRNNTLLKNDGMILYVSNRNNGSIPQVAVGVTGGWTFAGDVHRNNSHSGRLYHRSVGDNEPTQYTISFTNPSGGAAVSVDAEAFILPVRNYNPAGLLGAVVATTASAAATGTTQPITHSSVEAAVNDVHLLIAHMGGNQGSFTPPANYEEQLDFSTANVGISVTASAKVVTVGGQTGVQTTTGSFLASHAGWSILVKGAPALTAPPKPDLTAYTNPDTEGRIITHLSWGSVARADTVYVEMSVYGGPFVPVPQGSAVSGTSTSTYYELPPGDYQFRIYGSNAAGNGPYSDSFTLYVRGPLELLGEYQRGRGVLLTWTPSKLRETILEIYRAPVDDFGGAGERTLLYRAPTDVLVNGQYIDNTVEPGASYYYTVDTVSYDRTVSTLNETAQNPVVILPEEPPPPPPPPIVYDPKEEFAVTAMVHNVYHNLTDGTLSEVVAYSGFEYPERDRRTIQAPYQDGITTVGFSLKPRKFIITFQLQGRTPQELEEKRLRFLDLFEPTDDEMTLRFDTVTGRVLLIDASVDRMMEGEVNKQAVYYRRIVLQFHADDPAFYELESIVVPFSISVSAEGMDIPLEIPWAVGADELDMVNNIVYNGHAYVHPKIVISGPISNLRIVNESVGAEIVFKPNFTILEGEVFTIDTSASYLQVVDQDGRDRTDTLDDETDLSSFILSSSKKVPGGVNKVRVIGSNATEVTRIYLFYRTRWLAM